MRHLLIAAAVLSSCHSKPDSRGARPASDAVPPAIEAFDPAESSALFVGVRRFRYDHTLAEVRYAVDDAIDLAALLALDDRIKLVDPSRVVLALSGEPEKPETQRSLQALVAAGAQVRSADGPDVLNLLDDQSRAAGRKGVFIVSFATHGFSKEGTQYLLTATSILRHQEGAISDSEVRDIASQSDAARSLIFIDACRERLTENQRSGGPDARSAAPLLRAMAGVHGQVVLAAAAAGQYAYDDDSRRNGVFTAAVIDGLRCQAAADDRGVITVDSLASFVEQHVLAWVRRYRNAQVTHATQVSCEGSAKTMPLAACKLSVQTRTAPNRVESSPADPGRSIAVVVLGNGGEPVPHLAAAANNAIRESGYQPVSLVRSAAWTPAALQELAAGQVDSVAASRLPSVCRAVLAGTVARTAAMDSDPALQGLISTYLHLRFYLFDTTTGSAVSVFDSEAKGAGFSKESSEMQAWERAAAILRTEVRKIRWTESHATQ